MCETCSLTHNRIIWIQFRPHKIRRVKADSSPNPEIGWRPWSLHQHQEPPTTFRVSWLLHHWQIVLITHRMSHDHLLQLQLFVPISSGGESVTLVVHPNWLQDYTWKETAPMVQSLQQKKGWNQDFRQSGSRLPPLPHGNVVWSL